MSCCNYLGGVWCLDILIRGGLLSLRCIAVQGSDRHGLLWGTLCSDTVSLSACESRLLNIEAFKNATADFISVNGFHRARNTAERKGSIFLCCISSSVLRLEKMTVIAVTLFSNPLSSVAIAEWPPYRGVFLRGGTIRLCAYSDL